MHASIQTGSTEDGASEIRGGEGPGQGCHPGGGGCEAASAGNITAPLSSLLDQRSGEAQVTSIVQMQERICGLWQTFQSQTHTLLRSFTRFSGEEGT